MLGFDKFTVLGRGKYSRGDVMDHPWLREADTVVFIAGNEDYDPSETEEYDRSVKYRNVFSRLLRRDKEVVFLYLDRPKQGTLSATKFVETVRKNRSLPYRDERKYKNLRRFLPEGLSERAVRYIVRKLEDCDLH